MNTFFWNPQDDAERIQVALLRSPVVDRRLSPDVWVTIVCGIGALVALALGWLT